MEVCSTAGLPPTRRAAAWNELFASRIGRIEFKPDKEEDFTAELRLGRLGPITVVRLVSGRARIERSHRHLGSGADRAYSFVLQLAGRSLGDHCGQQTLLEAGDFTLCDSARPQSYLVDEGSTIITLRVAAEAMEAYLASPERLCGRRLPASQGLARTAAAMARSLCGQIDQGLSPHYEHCMAHHVLDVMATSYAIAFDALLSSASLDAAHYARVRRYIDDHLRDPGLSAGVVAEGTSMSRQHLRALFAARNETLSTYVLRRRLIEAARQIDDPKWRGHTITEIAFAWGFSSAAQFARSFREQFKVSPREYRRGWRS